MKKSISFFVIFGIIAVLLISGCTQKQPAGNQTAEQTPAGQPESANQQSNYQLEIIWWIIMEIPFIFLQRILWEIANVQVIVSIHGLFFIKKK